MASFKAPNLRAESLTIQNTFDPKAHPEVNEMAVGPVQGVPQLQPRSGSELQPASADQRPGR